MLPLPPSSTLFPYTTLFRSLLQIRKSRGCSETARFEHRLIVLPRQPVDIRAEKLFGCRAETYHAAHGQLPFVDRKSTRLNSSHSQISYAVFCLKKKKKITRR